MRIELCYIMFGSSFVLMDSDMYVSIRAGDRA